MLYSLEDYYKDFDSYSPFKKNLALDYPVHYGMKGVMVEKVVEPEKPPTQHNFSINMAYGERSQEVVFLQDKLRDLGYFPKTVLSTGGYFSITKDAVYRFQLENVNMSWYEKYVLKGSKVGPKTRFQLNIS